MAWTLIKKGGKEYESSNHKEWMLGSSGDIQTVPEDSGDSGSIAYTADLANIWQKAADGTWKAIG